MGIIRIPLVGQLTYRDTDNSAVDLTKTDQRFRNCHFDVFSNEFSGSNKIYVRPIEGFASGTVPGLGSNKVNWAAKAWTGHSGGANPIVSIWTNTSTTRDIYQDSTNLGTASGDIAWLSETSISGVANFVAHSTSGTGDTAYFYPQGGALTKITDAQYPANASLVPTGQMVHMDGYAFIMTTNGDIWNSDVNSLSAWTATSFQNAQFQPDGGVGLARYRKYIVAFGKQSFELFYNAGRTSGSPLAPVQGGGRNIGCVNQYTYCEALDTVFWAGSGKDGAGIFVLEGTTPKKISSPAIDLVVSVGAIACVNPYLSNGQILIGAWRTNGDGYLFSPRTRMWTEYQAAVPQPDFSMVDIYNSSSGIQALYCATPARTMVIQNSNTTLVTARIITSPLDFGTGNRKIINSATLFGEAKTSTTVTLTTADDDYTTFTNSRTFTLSTSSTRPRLYRLNGAFRSRAFRLLWESYGDDTCRLEALELDVEVLQS